MTPTLDVRTDRGVRLIVERSDALPLVDVELSLRTGATEDPAGKEGLTRLSWRVARMGPKGLSADDTEEAIARLGGRVAIETSASFVRVHASVIARNLDPFVALLAKLVLEPAFRPGDVARARREALAGFVSRRDDDRGLAGRAFRRQLFGEHAYGRPIGGTPRTVRGLRADDLRAGYRRHLRAESALIAFAGAVSADEARRLSDRHLGRIPLGHVRPRKIAAPVAPRGRRVVVVDKPARTQTQIYVGTLGTWAKDPLYYPLHVANTAFGGTFTSTLMQEVREKRGWSYGAYSRLGSDRQRDAFSMWTFPSAKDAVECVRLELALLERLVEEGPSARDHAFAKRFLVNSHCFDLDTAHKRLGPRIEADLYGLPAGHFERFTQHVRHVTRAASKDAVRRRLSSRDVTIALVATATEVVPGLERLPGVTSVEVVPYDRL